MNPSAPSLEERIAALESRGITLDQLPLADLRRKLIDSGEPLDLSVLALPGSVLKANLGGDALSAFLKLNTAADRRAAFGSNTLTFTAAATSANLTVAHGLKNDQGVGIVPGVVLAQAYSGVAWCLMQIVSKDATNIVFQGRDTDNVARTGSNNFEWVAIS